MVYLSVLTDGQNFCQWGKELQKQIKKQRRRHTAMAMMPVPDPNRLYWNLLKKVFNSQKVEDAAIDAAVGIGAFANPRQTTGDGLYLNPDAEVPTTGGVPSRDYYRGLVAEYTDTHLTDPAERARFKYRYSPQSETANRYNLSDLRRLRDLGRYLNDRSESAWLARFAPPDTFTRPDLELLIKFNKFSSALSRSREAYQAGDEFKDWSDLGVYGDLKKPWMSLRTYHDVIRHNLQKVDPVRQAQLDEPEEVGKAAHSARKDAKAFDVDEDNNVLNVEAIINTATQAAIATGDWGEIIRWSSNSVESKGVTKLAIPYDPVTEKRKYDFIEKRIQKLESDPRTVQWKAEINQKANLANGTTGMTYVTARNVAEMRELFFRSRDLVEFMSTPGRTGWEIKWEQAWIHMTDGVALVDRILVPAGTHQGVWLAGQATGKVTRKIHGASTDFFGFKKTPVTFLVLWAIAAIWTGIIQVALGGMNAGATLVVSFVLGLVFFIMMSAAAEQPTIKVRGMSAHSFLLIVFLVSLVVGVFAMIQQGQHLTKLDHERIQQREINAGRR